MSGLSWSGCSVQAGRLCIHLLRGRRATQPRLKVFIHPTTDHVTLPGRPDQTRPDPSTQHHDDTRPALAVYPAHVNAVQVLRRRTSLPVTSPAGAATRALRPLHAPATLPPASPHPRPSKWLYILGSMATTDARASAAAAMPAPAPLSSPSTSSSPALSGHAHNDFVAGAPQPNGHHHLHHHHHHSHGSIHDPRHPPTPPTAAMAQNAAAGAASKKAKAKKAFDSSEASKLVAARISQLEVDTAAEKEQEAEIGAYISPRCEPARSRSGALRALAIGVLTCVAL